MATLKVRTIDINTLEWFDKTYGNTYFASEITVNLGMKTKKSIIIPWRYGYGSHSENVCAKELAKLGYIPESKSHISYVCRCANIILRISSRTALLRELKALSNKEGKL